MTHWISRKTVLIILYISILTLSLWFNLVLLSPQLDNGITITYMEETIKYQNTQLSDCKALLIPSYQKIGHGNFMRIVNNTGLNVKDEGINDQSNREIYIGSLLFEFSKKNELLSIKIDEIDSLHE